MNRRILPVLTLVFTAMACGPKKVPPPPPNVQVAEVTTELATELVLGTAEYLSTVQVTRTPAFTATETAPASVVADQYTAAFQMVLPLQPGQNVFSFTATDPNGTSAPTSVTITRTAAVPTALTVLPLSPRVTAGNLIVRATISNPEAIALGGFAIDFVADPGASSASDGGAAAVSASASTDASGVAETVLQGLETAGPWTITATAKANPQATDSAVVIVNGGFGTAPLDLVLTGKDAAGLPVTSRNGAISVPAGATLTAQIAPAGQDQGPYLSIPFSLSTNAPGCAVQGNSLVGLNVASSTPYQVVATVPASAATGDQIVILTTALTVVPGAATKVAVALSQQRATADQPVAYTAVAQDALGNATGDALTPALTDAAGNVIYPGASPALAQVTGNATNSTGTVQIYVANTLAGTPVTLNGSTVPVGAGAAWTVTFTDAVTPTLKGSAALTVTPGAPASITLTLGNNSPNGSATIAAGTTLAVSTATVDDHQNAILGTPLRIFTSAPGAIVTSTSPGSGEILGLDTSNTATTPYEVWAVDPVTGLSSPLVNLFVTAGPASALHLSIAANNILSGNAVPYRWTITDASGNLVDLTSGGTPVIPTLSLTGPAGGALQSPPPVAPTFDAATNTGTGELAVTLSSPAGVYTIEAQVPASLGVAPSFQTVLVSAPQDVLPPTVSLLVTDGNGTNLAGSTVTNGQLIVVTVTACDDTALTSLYAQFSGASNQTFGPFVPTNGAVGGPGSACPGQQMASRIFTTGIGGGAGTVSVVATATDTANNTGVSSVVTFVLNPLQVDSAWVKVVQPLGQSSLPLNGPMGISVDSSNPSDVQFYLAQNGSPTVMKYDSATDAYATFALTGAGLGAPNFDIVEISGVLYVSQNNVNLNGGGGQGAIVSIPVLTPQSASLFSSSTNVPALMPEGLANCPLVTTSTTGALLTLDDQTASGQNEQGDFLSLSTGSPLAGGSVPLTSGAAPLVAPFSGLTGTNVDGSCATTGLTTDVVFASDDAINRIWWFKLSPTFASQSVVSAAQTCRLNGGGGSSCVQTPAGVRLSAGNHLVWANNGNGTVSYAAVNPATGGLTVAPATLVRGLNSPAGLAFDSAGALYVVDNGAGTPGGGTGVVYRLSLAAGF